MGGRFRGKSKWDPVLIIYQILTVQLLSYASLSILIYFASSLSEYTPSITFIFDYKVSWQRAIIARTSLHVRTPSTICVKYLTLTGVTTALLKRPITGHESHHWQDGDHSPPL